MTAQRNNVQSSFTTKFLLNLKSLSKEDKKLFDRIYKVKEEIGELVPPKEMESFIISNFGNVEEVKHQDFLKITDKIIYEGSLFNELRLKRPQVKDKNFETILDRVMNKNDCIFENPLTGTPADIFGRVKGKYCITCSNLAKYDGLHGIIIFDEHNPLLFSRRRVRDYFHVAKKWFIKAHKLNTNAIYPFYTWNCLWPSGASMIHGHSQVEITEEMPYSRIEQLRHLTLNYQERYRSNYFDDIYYLHEKLKLGFTRGNVKFLSKITPIKEKEVMILSHKFDDELADMVSDTLNTMKERLNVMSFNLSVVLPPIKPSVEMWNHMPIIVRIVDRGKLSNQTADVGAMELYAQSVIGTSPYAVYTELKKALIDNK